MYQKVKSLSRKKTQNTTKVIKDKQGKELTDPKEKWNRWKEYIEELYDEEGKLNADQLVLGLCTEGSQILKSEFDEAVKKLKNTKAEGINEIPAEFF